MVTRAAPLIALAAISTLVWSIALFLVPEATIDHPSAQQRAAESRAFSALTPGATSELRVRSHVRYWAVYDRTPSADGKCRMGYQELPPEQGNIVYYRAGVRAANGECRFELLDQLASDHR